MNSAQRALVVIGLLTMATALVVRPYEHVTLMSLAQAAIEGDPEKAIRFGFFPFWDLPMSAELHVRALLLVHGTIATLFCLAMGVAAPVPRRRGGALTRSRSRRSKVQCTQAAAPEPVASVRQADILAPQLGYELR